MHQVDYLEVAAEGLHPERQPDLQTGHHYLGEQHDLVGVFPQSSTVAPILICHALSIY